MAPLFTATNVTTLLRKVVHAARYVHPRATVATNKASRIHRARLALQLALHETYFSLSTSANQSHSLQPIRISSRSFTSSASRLHVTPLGRASQKFRMNPFRPAGAFEYRGASRLANIGLGNARTFATTGTIVAQPLLSATQANTSIVLRAFSDLLQDDNMGAFLPRASYHASFKPRRTLRRDRRRACRRGLSELSWLSRSTGSFSSTSSYSLENVDKYCIPHSHLLDLSHYFPIPGRSADFAIHLPPCPEHITTPSRTTTLSIDLRPSDEALLMSTDLISFRDVELGRTGFANLTGGVVSLTEAFSTYASTRVIPLIAKLESLGVISNAEFVGPETQGEVVYNNDKNPVNLLIVFKDRSEADVRAILGETLDGQATWYDIFERDSRIPSSPGLDASLISEAEEWSSSSESGPNDASIRSDPPDQATLAWSALKAPFETPRIRPSIPPWATQQENTSDLVMPSADGSEGTAICASGEALVEDILTPPESYSWPSTADESMMSQTASPGDATPPTIHGLASVKPPTDFTLANSLFPESSGESAIASDSSSPFSDYNLGIESSFSISDDSMSGSEISTSEADLMEVDEQAGEGLEVEVNDQGEGDKATNVGVNGG